MLTLTRTDLCFFIRAHTLSHTHPDLQTHQGKLCRSLSDLVNENMTQTLWYSQLCKLSERELQ